MVNYKHGYLEMTSVNTKRRIKWQATEVSFIIMLCLLLSTDYINPLRPNSDLRQTSHCNIKGLSVSEVMRIENMIAQVKFY